MNIPDTVVFVDRGDIDNGFKNKYFCFPHAVIQVMVGGNRTIKAELDEEYSDYKMHSTECCICSQKRGWLA